jgi:hypothetical protein
MAVSQTSAVSPYPRSLGLEQQPLLSPIEADTEGIAQKILRTVPLCGVVGALGGGLSGFILATDNHGDAVLIGAVAGGSGGAVGGAIGRVAAIVLTKLPDSRLARASISATVGAIAEISIGLGLNLLLEENSGIRFYLPAMMLGYVFFGVMSFGMEWLMGNRNLPAGLIGSSMGSLIGMGIGAGFGFPFTITDSLIGNTTGVRLGAAIGSVTGGFAGLLGGMLAPEERRES